MQLTDLNWPAVQDLSKNIPVVFPIAAPRTTWPAHAVDYDSMLLGEIIRRAAERLADRFYSRRCCGSGIPIII